MYILYILITTISVSFIVTGWQGFKDSPWENFVLKKYIRTYLTSFVISISLISLLKLQINFGVLILTTLAIERLVGEIYKGFLRHGSHPEYIHLFKKFNLNIKTYKIQLLLGIIVFLLSIIAILYFLQLLVIYILIVFNNNISGILVGFMGGLIVSIGGGIKDAQFEGFKPRKFFRSAIVGALGGFVLINFTTNPLLLLISCAGFERVFVELYKTFYRRSVRGIFEGNPVKYVNWYNERVIFFLQYLIGAAILAFSFNFILV